MSKILAGVTFGLVAAAMTSGCTVRTQPAVVVVEPAPVVVYQPVYQPAGKYLRKHKRHKHEDDQGEDEQ
jgi:hypothetical protein